MSAGISFPYWKDLVTIGQCGKPHGLSGELRVRAITDFPERFEDTEYVFAHQQKDPVRKLSIDGVRATNSGFLIKFASVTSLAEAEKLRGFYLSVPQDELVELEADEYWHWQLEGLNAYSPEGKRVGVLKEVVQSPAHDLYLIEEDSGSSFLVPAVHQYVPEIDMDRARIIVIRPELDPS